MLNIKDIFMSKKSFNFCDVIGYGWGVMCSNLWFFVGLGLVYIILLYLPSIAGIAVDYIEMPEPLYMILGISLQVIYYVVNAVLTIGMIKIGLSFCDERKPKISTLFDAFDCFWRYIGVAIVYSLIVIGGLLLFIVPGIIWSIKYSLCYYFVVDKGLGPIEAIKASGRATDGVKWDLFGFNIFACMIVYAGLLCFIVGILATYPIALIGYALVYRQLAAQSTEQVETAALVD